MAKKLDLNKPVFELVQEYPELVDVLKDLGFQRLQSLQCLTLWDASQQFQRELR